MQEIASGCREDQLVYPSIKIKNAQYVPIINANISSLRDKLEKL